MLMLYFTPAIMGTFAAAFVLAWYRAKASRAGLFYASGYVVSALAFSSELILKASIIGPPMAFATDVAFTASSCLICYGICVQFGRSKAYKPYLAIAGLHAMAQIYVVFFDQEVAMRVTSDVVATALVFLTTGYLLRGVKEQGIVLCRLVLKLGGAFYVCFAVASSTFLRGILNSGPIWESEHFHAVIVGTAVTGVALGCTLLINLIVAQLRSALDDAMTDPLTGLANRRGLDEVAVRLEEMRPTQPPPHGLIILDLDRFKKVNDTYGHPAGDEVLVEVSRRVGKRLRPNDSVVRLGGEEFCVVLPMSNTEMARLMAEQFRLALSDAPILVTSNDGQKVEIACTASFGVAEFCGSADLSDAMNTADQGLYCAKQMGRNRVCTYVDCVPNAAEEKGYGDNVYELKARA